MLLNINVELGAHDEYIVYGAPTTQIEKDLTALAVYWTNITVMGNYDKREDTFEIYDIYNDVAGGYESKESILDAYYHAGMPSTLKIFNRGGVS